ncbi:SUMF1/EgtB/PvdO family nonheme iron enzyme [Corallococcus macrosporus]|uniref:SUMF1/EgtB/PvdO family nonheme iron enzyme n=1 Tax=Corallococcus macrosporus TaxID=35 RepID=A0ABS3DNC4_9BACT|nr:SUMF1/EgtB/PvdO family nonheme iron enzyme [Corallococcus macrosporus]MBN8232828.1 SUMF1/EgtB/PvdO family nonheme iron enzyme [Corallococcus macrosporus]
MRSPALVARPEVSFEALDRVLEAMGWFLESESQTPPLIPGEPELAVYVHRGTDTSLHYTFNPVLRLRVLEFSGRDALGQWAVVRKAVPVLDAPALAALLTSSETREVLLGLLATETLRERASLDRVAALRFHPEFSVSRTAERVLASLVPDGTEEAFQRLKEEKAAHPDRSVLFAHLPGEEQRRQVLRWLIHDFTASNPDIDAVLNSALVDEDAEVRMTAVLAAARLQARSVLPAVREADIPTSTRKGAALLGRYFYAGLRNVVAELLAGRLPPPEGSAKRERMEPLLRALVGPVEVRNDLQLLLYALTTPVDPGPRPESLPEALVERDGIYRLRRSGLEARWVPPVEHWLGAEETLRRVKSPGYFVARVPVGRAAAAWALATSQGPVGTVGPDAEEPLPCTRAEAEQVCSALARIEGVELRLPAHEEWEMAARGPDGRLFPWGSSMMEDGASRASPWGVEKLVDSLPQWTREGLLCGGREQPLCSSRREVAAEAGTVVGTVRWVCWTNPGRA